ncbi:MAG: hypothetical protein HY394_01885 [Candidatus Diapherotrites archaeon]|nr:hypothetical protein [Candidatus Diapherotrites archaeon]
MDEPAELQEITKKILVCLKEPVQKRDSQLEASKKIVNSELTHIQLKAIANWKSPRIRRHFDKDKHTTILNKLLADLKESNLSADIERKKIKAALLELKREGAKGINLPMLSAILAFKLPDKYAVFDFRIVAYFQDTLTNTNDETQYIAYCHALREFVNGTKINIRNKELELWRNQQETQWFKEFEYILDHNGKYPNTKKIRMKNNENSMMIKK